MNTFQIKNEERMYDMIFNRDSKGNRYVWMHWQNLNEDRRGNVKGSILRAGRAWLHVFAWTFGWEWVVGKLRWSISLDINGGEHPLAAHAALFGFSGWVHAESPWLHRITRDRHGTTGVSLHDGCIWLSLWQDPNCWDSKAPWWRRGTTIHVMDLLLGRTKYTSEVLQEVAILVPMPERAYAGTAKMCRDTWSRSRWRTQTIYLAHVDMHEPIPEPGKGENSYDCGEDACHGMTLEALHVEDAIAGIVQTVMRARRRYGGSACGWRPEVNVRGS